MAARRKALGLTQAQVAERLGVDTETLSRFERGKHVPSLLTLERLAGQQRQVHRIPRGLVGLLPYSPEFVVADVAVTARFLEALQPLTGA